MSILVTSIGRLLYDISQICKYPSPDGLVSFVCKLAVGDGSPILRIGLWK